MPYEAARARQRRAELLAPKAKERQGERTDLKPEPRTNLVPSSPAATKTKNVASSGTGYSGQARGGSRRFVQLGRTESGGRARATRKPGPSWTRFRWVPVTAISLETAADILQAEADCAGKAEGNHFAQFGRSEARYRSPHAKANGATCNLRPTWTEVPRSTASRSDGKSRNMIAADVRSFLMHLASHGGRDGIQKVGSQ